MCSTYHLRSISTILGNFHTQIRYMRALCFGPYLSHITRSTCTLAEILYSDFPDELWFHKVLHAVPYKFCTLNNYLLLPFIQKTKLGLTYFSKT
jgi:hypothetical protein